jgi:hypothetical protein
VFIERFGMDKYMEEYGTIERAGEWGTWEPMHKYTVGNGIVGIEGVAGDLEKVVCKRFQFWCFPLRWYMGDGTIVRAVAEIDEDGLTGAPDRIYRWLHLRSEKPSGRGPICSRQFGLRRVCPAVGLVRGSRAVSGERHLSDRRWPSLSRVSGAGRVFSSAAEPVHLQAPRQHRLQLRPST